jgi:hypothetical protein
MEEWVVFFAEETGFAIKRFIKRLARVRIPQSS